MGVVFAGTPEFAVPTLRSLVNAGHDVAMVLTQPDRPAGRGRKKVAGPVKQYALEAGLPLRQPENLDDSSILNELRSLRPWVMVVAAYGLLLKRAVLALPLQGCVNVHASLLPRWRGAAPIQRAIEAGDAETGISIMQMEPGLDTGPVLARRVVPIEPTDTGGSLHDRLAPLGADLLVETLAGLVEGAIRPVPQDDAAATYAAKITAADSCLDWSEPAEKIERRVRAMNPWPVMRTRHGGELLRVWNTEIIAGYPPNARPGEILCVNRRGVDVACGAGVLRMTTLQREGGRRLPVADFLNGYPLRAGERFDS